MKPLQALVTKAAERGGWREKEEKGEVAEGRAVGRVVEAGGTR